MRSRVWLARRAQGPRVYHLTPDCAARRHRPVRTTERQARKVARLCRTCERAES